MTPHAPAPGPGPVAGQVDAASHAVSHAVSHAGRQRGLSTTGAALLSHSSNAVFLLPEVPAVARVSTGAGAAARIARTQIVTGWLADRGFGATAPLPGADQVDIDEHTTVSFWVYYPQDHADTGPPLDAGGLGRLLRGLHDLGDTTVDPPFDLPTWTPLESLAATVNDPAQSAALNDAERIWLLHRIHQIRSELAALDWPLGHGLIHGDAWAGNLLHDPAAGRVLLGDWDWVSHGPHEVDLIPTWHATVRYGRPPTWARAFVDRYGYDLATSPRYDVLLQMRDLVQLTGPIRRAPHSPAAANRLAQRLGDLRRGDRVATWQAR